MLTCSYTEHTHTDDCLPTYERLMKQTSESISEILDSVPIEPTDEEIAELRNRLNDLYFPLDESFYTDMALSEEEYQTLCDLISEAIDALPMETMMFSATLMGTVDPLDSTPDDYLIFHTANEWQSDVDLRRFITNMQETYKDTATGKEYQMKFPYDCDDDGKTDIYLQKNVIPAGVENEFYD